MATTHMLIHQPLQFDSISLHLDGFDVAFRLSKWSWHANISHAAQCVDRDIYMSTELVCMGLVQHDTLKLGLEPLDCILLGDAMWGPNLHALRWDQECTPTAYKAPHCSVIEREQWRRGISGVCSELLHKVGSICNCLA
jgi:hypothetical protein